MKKVAFMLLLVMIMFSCNEQETAISGSTEPGYPYTINFEKGLDNKLEITLSSIADSITYIRLDREMKVPLGRCFVLYVADDEVFVYAPGEESFLYRYNLKGELLNPIGKVGRGPGEYLTGTFSINEESQTIVAFCILTGHYLIYKYDGTYVGKLPVDTENGEGVYETHYLSDSTFLNIFSYAGYKSSLPEKFPLFRVFDNKDRTHFTYPHPVNREIDNINDDFMMFVTSSYCIRNGNSYNLFLSNSDSVFTVCGDTAFLSYLFDKGKYTPSEEYKYNYLISGRVEGDYPEYLLEASSLMERGNEVYIAQTLGTEKYIFEYNKETNVTRSMKLPDDEYEFVNDINGGRDFNIGGYNNNTMADIIHSFEFMQYIKSSEFKSKAYNDSISHEKLIGLSKEIKPDDNPILRIVHLKQ